MQNRRSPTLILQILLSLLLLIGEFGAVTHGYSHLPQEIQLSQQSGGTTDYLHSHKTAVKSFNCDVCLAYAALGAGLISSLMVVMVLGFAAWLLLDNARSFIPRLLLVFRSRAPPVFS